MDAKSKPRWGSWLVLGGLVVLLVVAIVVLFVGWDPEQNSAMTGRGYAAMALGIVATLALGIGLMMLVFYSSRSGRD
jgi:hypothetical protein